MGKYSGASDVKVYGAKNRFLNEEQGEHLLLVKAFRGGNSGADGAPYLAMDVEVLHSGAFREGETVTDMTKQGSFKGARNYFLSEAKSMVGAAQGFADASEVGEEDLEAAEGEEQRGVGAVISARVYQKTTKKGTTINKVAYSFVAASVDEIEG